MRSLWIIELIFWNFCKHGSQEILKIEIRQKPALQNYVKLIRFLNKRIQEVSNVITEKARNNKRAQLLMIISGVGYYSAMLILAEIGDIDRFPSAKKLCSYAGIAPSLYESGTKSRKGNITKQGLTYPYVHESIKKQQSL